MLLLKLKRWCVSLHLQEFVNSEGTGKRFAQSVFDFFEDRFKKRLEQEKDPNRQKVLRFGSTFDLIFSS